jgi:heme exporter protein A
MTSHDLARIENLATRFDVLSRGVIATSTARENLGKYNLLDFYRQSMAGSAGKNANQQTPVI